jgi:hypothetical protein
MTDVEKNGARGEVPSASPTINDADAPSQPGGANWRDQEEHVLPENRYVDTLAYAMRKTLLRSVIDLASSLPG